MKAQFKSADRLNAQYVAVLGEDELDKGIINCKRYGNRRTRRSSVRCICFICSREINNRGKLKWLKEHMHAEK